jgi:N-acetylmuramoyl-L-alanine amidase
VKPVAGVDGIRTSPEPAVLVNARAPAPITPVRPVPPIASQWIATTWMTGLPSAAPGATAILAAARAPALLVSRTVSNDWGRRLPNSFPARTAAILEAMREPASLTSRTFSNNPIRGLPNLSPAGTAMIADAVAVAALQPPPPLPSSPAPSFGPGFSAPSLGPGFSMARQLGLSVSRIVIDPGHGGHDPGAKGKGGITEAELVLDVSLRLEKLLAEVPGVEVILTRHADEFVALPERTAIANREGADLFLSIHANASPNDQAHGVEAYFLNFANNLSAAAVAARENATSGQAMGALPDFVRAIALNNKLDESRDFALLVQQSMVERLRPINKTIKDLGVKQAPFVVLIGASMPSLLAEISFLTHEQEAKLLKSSAYRQRIAEALCDAVQQYQGSLKRVQTVAQQ